MAQIFPIHAKILLGSDCCTGIWVIYLFFAIKWSPFILCWIFTRYFNLLAGHIFWSSQQTQDIFLSVTCFSYTAKRQTSARSRNHLLENHTRLPTEKSHRVHIDQKFASLEEHLPIFGFISHFSRTEEKLRLNLLEEKTPSKTHYRSIFLLKCKLRISFFLNKEIYSLMTGNFSAYNPREVLKQGILLEKVSQRYTCPDDGRKTETNHFFNFK